MISFGLEQNKKAHSATARQSLCCFFLSFARCAGCECRAGVRSPLWWAAKGEVLTNRRIRCAVTHKKKPCRLVRIARSFCVFDLSV
eukprot:1236690-Rhodomonas_salina.2